MGRRATSSGERAHPVLSCFSDEWIRQLHGRRSLHVSAPPHCGPPHLCLHRMQLNRVWCWEVSCREKPGTVPGEKPWLFCHNCLHLCPLIKLGGSVFCGFEGYPNGNRYMKRGSVASVYTPEEWAVSGCLCSGHLIYLTGYVNHLRVRIVKPCGLAHSARTCRDTGGPRQTTSPNKCKSRKYYQISINWSYFSHIDWKSHFLKDLKYL